MPEGRFCREAGLVSYNLWKAMYRQLLFTYFCRAKLSTQRLSPARSPVFSWNRRVQCSLSSMRHRLRWHRAATHPCRTQAFTPWGSVQDIHPCACSPGLASGPTASCRTSQTSCGSSCSTDSRHSRYIPFHTQFHAGTSSSPNSAYWLSAC